MRKDTRDAPRVMMAGKRAVMGGGIGGLVGADQRHGMSAFGQMACAGGAHQPPPDHGEIDLVHTRPRLTGMREPSGGRTPSGALKDDRAAFAHDPSFIFPKIRIATPAPWPCIR